MKKLFRSQMGCSILLMLTIFLASCQQDVTVSPIAAAVEPQVESTKIVDLDIQGVSLQDSILNFVDNATLSKAKALINGANSASYKAFCEKIGFKSLALIDDEFTVALEKCQTKEEELALIEANKDIFNSSNDHIRLKNTNSDLLRLLNRNSIFKVKNALYRFDEKGEILVADGDMNAMIRAIADRRETENVAIFSSTPLMVRADRCVEQNTSHWQYAQANDRRARLNANVRQDIFVNGDIWDVVTNFLCEAVAEKKTIFKSWRSYTTDNKLTIREVKIEVPSVLPASWGIRSFNKFYLDRVENRSGSSVSFSDEVARTTVHRLQFNRNAKPSFEYVSVSYENRGGVMFDYDCDR